MTRYNKSIIAALVGAIALLGAANIADARGHGGYGHGGYGHGGYGHGYAMQDVSPEHQQMMAESYDKIAPLQLELRAKQQELTAKIYGGADEKSIKATSDEVNALQARVTAARMEMQKRFAAAGIPMHMGRGAGCPGFGAAHMGHGDNCFGFGRGYHGGGPRGGYDGPRNGRGFAGE